MPALLLRNRHELGPGTVSIHADTLRVGTQVTPTGQTIPAMAAGDVTFADDEIALGKTLHLIADKIDNADEFVADRHGHGDGLLCPGVPIVNVDIGFAERRVLGREDAGRAPPPPPRRPS